MRAERDIAGIALFFTSGIAVGEMLFRHIPMISGWGYLAAGTSSAVVAILIPACMLSDRSSKSASLRIFLTYLLAGISCHAASHLGGLCGNDSLFPAAGTVSGIISSHSESFKEMIDSIPYPEKDCNGLIKAFITGDKTDVPPEISRAFRDSGASHILALSGMHLGVLYGVLLKITAVSGNSPAAKKWKSVTIMTVSAYYTIMTGAAASLVRALLFIMLNETAKILGRETRPMNVFLAALTVQLAFAPENISSAGFQLSYLAMAGIYILYPRMKAWFPASPGGRRWPMKRIWDAAALTISCQIFTAPAAWLHFGTFPEYFIITNLLAVPLSTFIMLTASGIIVLWSIGICPEWLILANWHSTRLLNHILTTICSLP